MTTCQASPCCPYAPGHPGSCYGGEPLGTADGLAGLREVAERATRGPWEHYESDSDAGRVRWHVDSMTARVDVAICPHSEADAAFIAAFDPPTALALLTAVEDVRRLREELNGLHITEHEAYLMGYVCEHLDAALAPLDGGS